GRFTPADTHAKTQRLLIKAYRSVEIPNPNGDVMKPAAAEDVIGFAHGPASCTGLGEFVTASARISQARASPRCRFVIRRSAAPTAAGQGSAVPPPMKPSPRSAPSRLPDPSRFSP